MTPEERELQREKIRMMKFALIAGGCVVGYFVWWSIEVLRVLHG